MTKSTFSLYAEVILDVSVDKTLDYGIPEELVSIAKPGMRAEVPVRGFARGGYIIATKNSTEAKRVRPLYHLTSEEELIPPPLMELAVWIARYYCTPLRQVLKTMLPSSIRKETQPKQQLYVMRKLGREALKEHCIALRNKSAGQAKVLDEMLLVKKGILLSELLEKTGGSRSPVDTLVKKGHLEIDIIRIDRSPLIDEEYFRTKAKTLNNEQQKALDKINDTITSNKYETHLLYGVTGSGKTEVYLQAIDTALKMQKGTIMMVPEISLTAQTIERFRSRFDSNIAILHYRLSQGERCDEWRRIKSGEAKIVIGARSAIFSPVPNLGLIIVDEEHEKSYKQSDEAPCYHARDLAVVRGHQSRAAVILGSATPSIESFYNCAKGKYTLSKLSARAEDTANLPTIVVVDMKREQERAGGYTNFSEPLLQGIKARVKKGEQTILFLNRRGYHTTLLCPDCDTVVQCKHCDVSLTFHRGDNILSCHLCGYTLSPPPKACPSCESGATMKFRGVGTELIEKSLQAILPEVRTIRVDGDTTRHKGSHQRLLRDFGTGKADVLIGTQMIAKGLHFPEVTLVGVLNCDGALNIPDFRASENVFQLITQVAGRAGRGAGLGEVLIQTCMPDNSTIKHAAAQNFEDFYAEEVSVREHFIYPPFSRMAKVSLSGPDAQKTLDAAEHFRTLLMSLLSKAYTIYPIVPAPHARVKDRFLFQLIIKGPQTLPLSRALAAARDSFHRPKEIRIKVDIDTLF